MGIDIAKHQLDLAVWGCPQEDDRLAHDRQGMEAVCQRMCDLEPALIVMEASGGLEVPLATTLQAAGLPVAVVNPRRARAFGRASGQLAKTDRMDARLLARMAARTVGGGLPARLMQLARSEKATQGKIGSVASNFVSQLQ